MFMRLKFFWLFGSVLKHFSKETLPKEPLPHTFFLVLSWKINVKTRTKSESKVASEHKANSKMENYMINIINLKIIEDI